MSTGSSCNNGSPPRQNGFEFEGVLGALPSFDQSSLSAVISSEEKAAQPHILEVLLANPARGESGPAWNTLVTFTVVTAALKRTGLRAGIYEGALAGLEQLLAQGDRAGEIREIFQNLRDVGFVVQSYTPDTFGIGFDSSTYALPERNADYYTSSDAPQNPFGFNQFCGFEINGPVFASPEKMADTFERMINSLKPLGLLTPETCGIHQHIDISGSNYRQLINVMRIHAFCDAALRQAVFPPHRRDSRFCRPLDYYFGDVPGYTPLEQLSHRLNSLRTEYDRRHYDSSPLTDPQLMEKIATDIQANIFPSGRVNESFYNLTDAISTALANSTIIPSACLDNLALDLRRQRYFDPSPESPMKHGTLERRWMPATNDPDLVRAWFILNDALARRALDCDNSSITVCNNTHYLTIVNASGQAQTFSQNLESIMGWLGVTQETIDTLTAAANDNRRWGYDLAQNNNGLWPQAPIAAASLPPSADTVSDARNEIYAAAISALLCLNRQQDTGKLIEHYVRSCSAAER